MKTVVAMMKKELLLFWRNPQELLVTLIMPLILITILGFALGSVLNGEADSVTGKAALVVHSSEEDEFQSFKNELAKHPIPEEVQEKIVTQIEKMLPIHMLKEQVFGTSELQSVIKLEELPIDQLQKAKADGEYSAIIEVPAGFTNKLLTSLFIEDSDVPDIHIYLNEGKETTAVIVEDILTTFQRQYSIQSRLGKEQLLTEGQPFQMKAVSEHVTTVNNKEPINAFSYYTVGMSVMFVLFIASIISSRSFIEKQTNVLNRMLLANISRWSYLAGVFTSTVVVASLQMLILYGGAALFYDVYWPNVLAFLCVTLAIAFTVGGISMLLTALNFRLNSESASKLFMTAFVAVLSFFGGSFVPVRQISETLENVGNWTPNGAAMAAYLEIMQGASVNDISQHLIVLGILTVILLFFTWLLIPRKAGMM